MNSPIDILSKEHALIRRMLVLLGEKVEEMESTKEVDVQFIEIVTDFFESFIDRNHHYKEERIFFKGLSQKDISEEHKEIMNRLIDDHERVRGTIGAVVLAKAKYMGGDLNIFNDLIAKLKIFNEIYPPHIEIEDGRFFTEGLEYFNEEELNNMIDEFNKTDPEEVLLKYTFIVESIGG